MWPTRPGSPSWTVHGLVRPSFVPPRPVRELREPDPLPQDPDPKSAPGRPQRPGQGPAGRRDLSCPAWPPTSSASPAEPCWKPWSPAPTTRRCWPRWPRAGSAAKLPALREALAGRFRTDHHGLVVAQILAHIDYLDETIATLSARIQQVIAPFARAGGAVGHHPRDRPARRRGHPGRDRPGHGPVPHRRPSRLLGGGVSWEQRVGRQAPLGADPQGLQVAGRLL